MRLPPLRAWRRRAHVLPRVTPVRVPRRVMAACAALPIFAALLTPARASAPASTPVRDESPAAVAAALPQRQPGYPLIANYNGFMWATDVPAFAYENLIVAPEKAAVGNPSPIALLRLANPHAKILLYQRTLQVDYPLIRQMYGVDTIFPGWWLLRAGSVLTAAIDARQTSIPVADPTRFHVYDDVLVDSETMHVLAINGATLIVRRGFYSRAAAHAAGVRIAAHYSYRVDLRNSIIRGKGQNRRPWSFNLSTNCPRDSQGRTWNDFLAARMAGVVRQGGWDGVFFDNTDELPRDPWLDANNDNIPDGGVIGGHNVWHDGELYLLQRFHQLAPHALIIDNGTLDGGITVNGREFEGFPLTTGLYMGGMSDYAYWQRHDARPTLDIVNPDTTRSPRPNLGAMRFGLASALLGDGFYSYDEGWHRHGAVWTFDEYDDGAGSALLHDVGPHDSFLRVAHTFRFHGGDLIMVGREQMRVLDLGSWNLIVKRGVNGTRATSHPAGSAVATPAQMAAGSGYLGFPLDKAHLMSPPVTTPNLVANGGFFHAASGWQLQVDGTQIVPVTAGSFATGLGGAGHVAQAAALRADPSVARSGLRDAAAYGVSVPWQPLRVPNAVRLTQRDIEVRPETAYTLTFWARGTPGMTLPVLLSGERPGFHMRYAPDCVTLHQGWYRYVLRYTAPSEVTRLSITFQFGHTFGRSAITGVQLQQGQALVYGRDFQHGLVLVNEGDQAQYVRLPHTYWHLLGDQDPAVNNGQPVRAVTLPGHAGLILLDAPPPQQG